MDAAGSVFQVVDAHLLLARTFRYGSLPRGQLLSPPIMPVVSVASYKKSVGSDCPRRLGWRALTRSILGIKIAACGMILRMKGVQHNTSLFSLPHMRRPVHAPNGRWISKRIPLPRGVHAAGYMAEAGPAPLQLGTARSSSLMPYQDGWAGESCGV